MSQTDVDEKNTQDILISVIVPVYNIEKYLKRCVQSIQNQTYKNLEILLVDDGSTDQSGALCEACAEEDLRIRVFHKTNGGSSSARNVGIREAKGRYIGFVDSDDYISPGMYEKLLRVMEKYHLPMAQISRDEIDEDGNRRPDVCIPPKQLQFISGEEMMQQLLLHLGDCSFCTRLTEKTLFEENQFPENKLNEDFYLLSKMLLNIQQFAILPDQDYHVFYRLGSNTRTVNRNEFSPVYQDIVENADFVMELVKEHYPALQAVAERFSFYQRLDYLLHIPVPMMTKENPFYLAVIAYLRKHWVAMLMNAYLSKKNKLYLFLFTIAPKGIRQLHKKIKRL